MKESGKVRWAKNDYYLGREESRKREKNWWPVANFRHLLSLVYRIAYSNHD